MTGWQHFEDKFKFVRGFKKRQEIQLCVFLLITKQVFFETLYI